MEINQLEAFRAVVKAGSFRRASRALYLSHPALGERIKRLERDLGYGLFVREGNRLRLSPAGRAFLPFAERTLDIQRQSREVLSAKAPMEQEWIRLGSTPTVITYFLPQVLARFQLESTVGVHVESIRTARVLTSVLKEDMGLGVMRLTPARAMALTHPDAEFISLFAERVVLVTDPLHPFAFRGKASLAEVVSEPLVLYSGNSFFPLVEQACAGLGVEPHVRMMLSTIGMAKSMVEHGLGISLLPWTAVRQEVQAGSLVCVPLAEGREPVVTTVAVVKRGRPLGKAMCRLLSLLVEEAAELDTGPPR